MINNENLQETGELNGKVLPSIKDDANDKMEKQ
jgi:hypothetical protein